MSFYCHYYYYGVYALLILQFLANSNAYITLRRRNDGKIEQIFNSEAGNLRSDENSSESDDDRQLAVLEAQLLAELSANNLNANKPIGAAKDIANNQIGAGNSPFGSTKIAPQQIDLSSEFKVNSGNARMNKVAKPLRDSQKTSVNFDMDENYYRDALNFVDAREQHSILNQHQAVSDSNANVNLGTSRRKSGNDRMIDKNVIDYGKQREKNVKVDKQENGTNVTSGEDIFVDALKRVLVEFKREMMSGKFGPKLRQKSEELALRTEDPTRSANPIHERPYIPRRKKLSKGVAQGLAADSSEVRRKPLDQHGAKVWRRVKFTTLPSRLTT